MDYQLFPFGRSARSEISLVCFTFLCSSLIYSRCGILWSMVPYGLLFSSSMILLIVGSLKSILLLVGSLKSMIFSLMKENSPAGLLFILMNMPSFIYEKILSKIRSRFFYKTLRLYSNSMEIDYTYQDRKYTVVFPKKRGPSPHVTYIMCNDKNITTDVKRIAGPFLNFHGNPRVLWNFYIDEHGSLTQSQLSDRVCVNNLTVYYLDGTSKKFTPDEDINL
jgi:hypothetical protein